MTESNVFGFVIELPISFLYVPRLLFIFAYTH
jgi:hypothetical protein